MMKQEYVDQQSAAAYERLNSHPLVAEALADWTLDQRCRGLRLDEIGARLKDLEEREPEVRRLLRESLLARAVAEVDYDTTAGPAAPCLRLDAQRRIFKKDATPKQWAEAARYEASLCAEGGEIHSAN